MPKSQSRLEIVWFKIQTFWRKLKISKTVNADAAYLDQAGEGRSMFFVVGMDNESMIPAFLEPLFQEFKVKIAVNPVKLF